MGKAGSKNLSTTLHQCTLWKSDRSPSCRAVMMALDAMNMSLTEVDVNMDKAEHRVPELAAVITAWDLVSLLFTRLYLISSKNQTAKIRSCNNITSKLPQLTTMSCFIAYLFTQMNPLQTLPIFKDRQLVLCDSHVINTYLASRYCSSDYTLPEDPAGRAIVDQLLHYNSGLLQPNYRASSNPILYENCKFVMPQQITEIERSYQDLENMLVGRTWFSGSRFTLGDISLAASVSTLNILLPVDGHRFPLLSSWLFRMSEQPFYITANKKGLQEFWKRIDSGIAGDLNEFKKCPRSSLTRRSHGGKLSEK